MLFHKIIKTNFCFSEEFLKTFSSCFCSKNVFLFLNQNESKIKKQETTRNESKKILIDLND